MAEGNRSPRASQHRGSPVPSTSPGGGPSSGPTQVDLAVWLWASDDLRAQPHITILDRPCFLYPVCQVSNKVEEEVILGDADDLGTWPFQSIHFSSTNTDFSDLPTKCLPFGPLLQPKEVSHCALTMPVESPEQSLLPTQSDSHSSHSAKTKPW